MRTSATWSKPRLGSITRPPFKSSDRITPGLRTVSPRRPAQHVGPLDRLLDAAEAAHAELLDAARQERIGAAHADFGAELQEAPDVRAGDARVHDIAHETHLDALDSPVFVADGQEIEQALRGI